MSTAFEATLESTELPLRMLRRDGETQSRTRLNPEVIEAYAELMLGGIKLPPVRVCFDGTNYWLTDGFHRVAAVERLRRENIRAEVFHGSLTDAQWDSYQANATHGLRRMPDDLKLVIVRALRHQTSAKLTNCELARHLHVSEKTIRRFRTRASSARAEDERVATRNGRQYKIQTVNIGKTTRTRERAKDEVAASLKRRLAADLLMMDREASPDVRRILNVFRNWTERSPDPSSVLEALAAIVTGLKANSTTVQSRRA